MNRSIRIWTQVIAGLASAAFVASAHPAEKPLAVSGFRDCASHWRNIRDSNRIIQPRPNQPSWRADQMEEIAANLLLFQRSNGGWPKDYDMTAVLDDDQKLTVASTRDRTDTSFDNHNVFPQVIWLAGMYQRTERAEYRESCERGIDFVLNAQYPGGGFPQRYPDTSGYHGHITFNDGAMMGLMNLLKSVSEREPPFEWVDDKRKAQAADAVHRGIACILKCQIIVDGIHTGWCQQHDRDTHEPVPARSFELASICPQETTEIVLFLQKVQQTDSGAASSVAEQSQFAVTAALEWLQKVKLAGIRVEKVPAPPEDFLRHTADFDIVVREDPSAPAIWARHYEIGTNRPIFAGRDGVRKYSLLEVARERRTGTRWYGDWPADLLARNAGQKSSN